MLINVKPLFKYRNYRLLYAGQMISLLGSMVSYVAIPYQVYELTKSSFYVGLLGAAQLIPVLIFGLIGGAKADSMDRKKLLLTAEATMCIGVGLLFLNACLPHPSIIAIFSLVAIIQSANGFHRPAMEALTQKFVEPQDYAFVGALNSFKYCVGAIVGPSLGGVLIAWGGTKVAYALDFATFFAALIFISLLDRMPAPEKMFGSTFAGIKDGLKYALKRPELMGTYIVDIIAMTFAFPTALFPAMSEQWGGAKAAGILFSSMAIGSLMMTVFSGWTKKVHRHGAAVTLAAAAWGFSIVALGFSNSLWAAVACLIFAGAADMISGLFRGIIWNETIPNNMRGRLSGIEMISYMSGPLLGNTRAGWMASATTTSHSILFGGVICIVGVFFCAIGLPRFWKYRSQINSEQS